MARLTRTALVSTGIAALAIVTVAAFGRMRVTRPLVRELTELGGEYRELRDSLGITHGGVVHRIEAHCYSPGIGFVLDAPTGASPDSLFVLASLLRSALQHEARVGEDRYLTITLDAGHATLWPFASRVTHTFAWTWSERQQRWIHFAFSVPPDRVPRALQPGQARRSGPEQPDT